MQRRLEKKLGPEYISSRPGPSGQPVHYITAEKVISLANDVFGFNGWSSSIQNIQVDYVEEHPTTHRITLGLSVVVRVTLRDGVYHEDIGYGQIENAKSKAAAFEKSKKEATTDAMKRALRHFGNVLGNCIYDKDYVKRVSRIKVGTGKPWNLADLHRHADFKGEEGEEFGQQASKVPQGQSEQQQQPQQQQQWAVPGTTNGLGTGQAGPVSAPSGPVKQESNAPRTAAETFDDFLGSLDGWLHSVILIYLLSR